MDKNEGRKLGAFDAFIGNMDRHPANIVYWMTGGGIPVAIDNERLGYAQNWTQSFITHMDVLGGHQTPLFEAMALGINSGDPKRRKSVKSAAREMKLLSAGHEDALNSMQSLIQCIIDENFSDKPSANLLCYLGERVVQNAIDVRYGALI